MNRRNFLKYMGFLSIAAMGSGIWMSRPLAKNPYYKGPKTDHFDGRVFYNPNGIPPGKVTDLLRWQFNGQRSKWPDSFDSPHHGAAPKERSKKTVVTHIGHASFLVQTNDLNILIDPVYSDRASPVSFAGPKRINKPGIAFDKLPPIDIVLVTHNHYDHLDMPTLDRLVTAHNPKILTPLGNDTLIQKSIPSAQIISRDWDEVEKADNSTLIHFEPCHHWGARGMRDRRMTLWSAFTIETPTIKIHHIGDTGFHEGINFKKAFEKHGRFDLAILPIGAYAPRWFMKPQHMNPQEAVEAFKLLNADQAIGHHWGTFQLTDEPITEPAELLEAALVSEKISSEKFYASKPGQTWTSNSVV